MYFCLNFENKSDPENHVTVSKFKRIKRSVNIPSYNVILVSSELGNAKKDLIYMSISGLDQVDFGNKDLSTCVTTGVIGAGSVQDQDQTYCISEQKIID